MKNFYKGGRDMSYFDWIFHLFKSKNNRSRTLFCFGICFVLLFSNQLTAQEPRRDSGADRLPEILPIAIGELIPPALWELPLNVVNHPLGNETIKLGDYQDRKLIILDFWATWCGSCLRSMAKIQALEKDWNDSVLFLPVNAETTGDIPEKIRNTFTRFQQSTGTALDRQCYVFPDRDLYRFFPHKALPHVVWIFEGRYIGSTYAEAVTTEHIKAVLHSGGLQRPVKKDLLTFSPTRMIAEQLPFSSISREQNVLFTRYIEGLGFDSGTFYTHDAGLLYRISNFELLYFFYIAFPEIFHGVKTDDIVFSETLQENLRRELVAPVPYEDGYCFELFSKDTLTIEMVRKRLSEVLGTNFDVELHRDEKLQKVMELVPMDAVSVEPQQRGKRRAAGKHAEERSWKVLLGRFKETWKLPVVDHSGIAKGMVFDVPVGLDFGSREQVEKFLAVHGLTPVEKQVAVPIVVFTPKNIKYTNETN
ncbi:TlpA family protein disulfide reductase [Sphingobacterium sp. LRF_L2]|uniref:TlpA family protein disulfide reductase n=1 Tax=Sphingobacterium sp. LRF_L2 TaxID=3369421 RepID=UPI003F61808E